MKRPAAARSAAAAYLVAACLAIVTPAGIVPAMKVSINETLCDGDGRCVTVCPQVFARDEDTVFVLDPAPEPSLRECVRMAEKLCPHKAIMIET
jgi:ferredoxin